MDTKQNRNTKEKVMENLPDGNNKLKQAATKQLQVPTTMAASPPPSASSSSSPSREFSFTISLHSSSTPVLPDKSPADDIFFHGHLLPLHLLSHLPVSPRSSTNSLDSSTLPVKELLDNQKPTKNNNNLSSIHSHSHGSKNKTSNGERKERKKTKSFSLFRWKKGFEVRDREDKENQKKSLRFEVTQLLKRYARMFRWPLLFFKRRREKNNLQFHRQSYSFSGNLSLRNKEGMGGGRRRQYSAPASMRTSPSNSGLLVTLPSSKSDSTMEELQAAIQAAIDHCKNSIAAEKKIEC